MVETYIEVYHDRDTQETALILHEADPIEVDGAIRPAVLLDQDELLLLIEALSEGLPDSVVE